MHKIAFLLLAFLFSAFAATSVTAQGTGHHTTGIAKDSDAGKKNIKLDTGNTNDVTVEKVWIWEPMSETWVEIEPNVNPNPGGDNKITLPKPIRSGDKFKIKWKSTQGSDIEISSEFA